MNVAFQQPDAPPPTSAQGDVAVSRWAIHRRLYNWMLSFSHTRYSSLALFLFSFAEAIFFPIPPLVLQVPMTLELRSRAWRYATVATIGSILGGLVGYGVGLYFSHWVSGLFEESEMAQFRKWSGNVWMLTGGAIAVHPYKLYTIAAGLLAVPVWSFIVASIVGRGIIFYGAAALLVKFGAPVKHLIERYFNLLTVVLGVFIIGLIVAIKMF